MQERRGKPKGTVEEEKATAEKDMSEVCCKNKVKTPDTRNRRHKKMAFKKIRTPMNTIPHLEHSIQLFFYRQTLKLQAEFLERKQDGEKEYRFTAFTGDM